MLYAMVGRQSNELVSYAGKVLTHTKRSELEFLFDQETVKVIPCPSSVAPDSRMSIRLHPELQTYQWPLRRKDFR